MRILRREEVWIHTHFVTNTRSEDKGLHIVLECLPFPETLKKIESALAEILKPIPARPRNTRLHIEPPEQPTSLARRQT